MSRLGYMAAVAGLLLPLALVALAGVTEDGSAGSGITLRWFADSLADPGIRRAFGLSVVLAAGSAAVACLVGTWVALAAHGAGPRTRWALGAAVLLPLVLPGLVHALALRMTMQVAGLPPGPVAVLLGHAIHGTPYVALMVGARRAGLPPALLDAARDLGATPAGCLRLVVVPWLRPALAGAAALVALASFDDFVRSFFLGGYEPTLPVLMFARMQGGLEPPVAAVATAILAAVSLAGWLASIKVGSGGRPDPGRPSAQAAIWRSTYCRMPPLR